MVRYPNGGRLIVSILALCVTLATLAEPAAAANYKYGTVYRTSECGFEGLSADFVSDDPIMRDSSGTHSIIQHWIGNNTSYVEVGWRKVQGGGQTWNVTMWWGYHDTGGNWSGYHEVGNAGTYPTAHNYKIVWNSGGQWDIYIDNAAVGNVPQSAVPGPSSICSTIETGGEITWTASSPGWNQMGYSTNGYMKYKKNGAWSWWYNSQDPLIQDSNGCSDPVYHNAYAAPEGRLVYGCL
jgi:hypothetical protein